ncbi:MAG: phospholipase D-like domain-containing protein [Planctomycetaceae bacterium]
MTTDELTTLLRATLDDLKLSRSERQAISAVLADVQPTSADLGRYRAVAFDLARGAVAGSHSPRVLLDWLEEVIRVLQPPASNDQAAERPEVWFSPGDDCRNRIIGLLRQARSSVNLCVFTITDDLISNAILDTHRRGVRLRIMSDNDKASDLGSDLLKFERAGIPVRFDRGQHHMHHKFAIFDDEAVVTGSYNWTVGAALDNEEHIVVLHDTELVARFLSEFEKLWREFG